VDDQLFEMNNAIGNVPWRRFGHPFIDNVQSDAAEWEHRVANKGIQFSRLKSDEEVLEIHRQDGCCTYNYCGDIQERIFAEMWDYENNGGGRAVMDHILEDELVDQFIKGPKDRYLAEIVAQSVIQWLGTNVGSCFVDEVHKLIEKRRGNLIDKIDEEKQERKQERKDALAQRKKEIQSSIKIPAVFYK